MDGEVRFDDRLVPMMIRARQIRTGTSRCEVLAALGKPQETSYASYRGPMMVYPIGSKPRFIHLEHDKVEHWSD